MFVLKFNLLVINCKIFLIIFASYCSSISNNIYDYDKINLPKSHLSPYFNKFSNIRQTCLDDTSCKYRDFLLSDEYDHKACWGYEFQCNTSNRIYSPECPGEHTGWVQSKEQQLSTFFAQADFGYIKEQIYEMIMICQPVFVTDSFLECSKYLRFCRGKNLMINFTDVYDGKPTRYNTSVLEKGKIGGYCEFNKTLLNNEGEHFGALQSWIPELRFFEQLSYRPLEEEQICDIIIDKPTYIMKIDATTNMYHHFCDFVNLYMSQHVNQSHFTAFETDVHILIWETHTYQSAFAETFKAFTSNPIWDLKTFHGKAVCFRNVVLPLLPRMIFGLYYNTPIISGCWKSGLFRAFSEHILHRLKIPMLQRTSKNIRITFLTRRTKYRQVLNEEELLDKINSIKGYSVRRVSYESLPFREQLKITHNTDIFISMHGAGLTHLLFLPNWACVFELYNCEDPNCYKDLARLKGVEYVTWEKLSKLKAEEQENNGKDGAHAKFTNYWFDKNEFVRLIRKCEAHVKQHKDFKMFLNNHLENTKHEEL